MAQEPNQESSQERSYREKARYERFKVFQTVTISLVGMIVGVAAFYAQFARPHEGGSGDTLQLLVLQKELSEQMTRQLSLQAEMLGQLNAMSKRLEDLEKRIEQLEKSAGKPTAFRPIAYKTVARASPQVPATSPPGDKDASRDKDPKDPPDARSIFDRYVRPAIYSGLGFLLIFSAVVTLGTSDAARRETALEFTRTLMTFFIGAATSAV